MNKKEKKYFDPQSINSSSTNKLINSSFFTYYEEELKAIQRSIALLRQDLPKIINDELIKFPNNRQERRF
ncbi:MAG TPA: hypothetical protein VFM28_04270 [Nitrososphaeraceae archaeon]|jgi:hypothetical protein|nr:hypothetical protein [Nitrososphaeraceae archaeon]